MSRFSGASESTGASTAEAIVDTAVRQVDIYTALVPPAALITAMFAAYSGSHFFNWLGKRGQRQWTERRANGSEYQNMRRDA
jgi:hypothetical protein